jgi:hypothetical protein
MSLHSSCTPNVGHFGTLDVSKKSWVGERSTFRVESHDNLTDEHEKPMKLSLVNRKPGFATRKVTWSFISPYCVLRASNIQNVQRQSRILLRLDAIVHMHIQQASLSSPCALGRPWRSETSDVRRVRVVYTTITNTLKFALYYNWTCQSTCDCGCYSSIFCFLLPHTKPRRKGQPSTTKMVFVRRRSPWVFKLSRFKMGLSFSNDGILLNWSRFASGLQSIVQHL